jgi:hypothetical protein
MSQARRRKYAHGCATSAASMNGVFGGSDRDAIEFWTGLKKDIRRGCDYFWAKRPGKKPSPTFQR